MAVAVVHKEEEIIIRLHDSEYVVDAEMTAICLAIYDASETRDHIRTHTDTLTAVKTITRVIRDAASRLTQRPTINWIPPPHTGIPGIENVDQALRAANIPIEYTLQLPQALSE